MFLWPTVPSYSTPTVPRGQANSSSYWLSISIYFTVSLPYYHSISIIRPTVPQLPYLDGRLSNSSSYGSSSVDSPLSSLHAFSRRRLLEWDSFCIDYRTSTVLHRPHVNSGNYRYRASVHRNSNEPFKRSLLTVTPFSRNYRILTYPFATVPYRTPYRNELTRDSWFLRSPAYSRRSSRRETFPILSRTCPTEGA